MRSSRTAGFRLLIVAACLVGLAAVSLSAWAQDPTPADSTAAPKDAWPRQSSVDGLAITVYQPQVESWVNNLLTARSAVSLQEQASPTPIFGVVLALGAHRG